jgi:hypothetical protein
VRVDGAQVQLTGDEKDHGSHGTEPRVAPSLPFGSLEEAKKSRRASLTAHAALCTFKRQTFPLLHHQSPIVTRAPCWCPSPVLGRMSIAAKCVQREVKWRNNSRRSLGNERIACRKCRHMRSVRSATSAAAPASTRRPWILAAATSTSTPTGGPGRAPMAMMGVLHRTRPRGSGVEGSPVPGSRRRCAMRCCAGYGRRAVTIGMPDGSAIAPHDRASNAWTSRSD